MRPGLLVHWPGCLMALAFKESRSSVQSGSYTSLIGFNARARIARRWCAGYA